MYFKKKVESVGGWVASRWQGYLFDRRAKAGSLYEGLAMLGSALTDNDDDAPTFNVLWNACFATSITPQGPSL